MPATALATASAQQQAGAGALPAARSVLETQLPHAAAAAQKQLAALQPGRSSSSSINTAEEDEDNICAICLGGYAEGAQVQTACLLGVGVRAGWRHGKFAVQTI